jgi:hypothetical protein
MADDPKPTIIVPPYLNPGPSLAEIATWGEFETVPELALDFRVLSFARPFGALAIAEALSDLLEKRRANGLSYEVVGLRDRGHGTATSYLAHVGFFSHLGINFGNAPGEAAGNDRYVPITVLSRSEFGLGVNNAAMGNSIEQKADQLASMIFVDDSKRDMLSYCIREVVRNVFEHAAVDSCAVMAQKYREDDVEIAIADRGIGVLASLSQSHDLSSPSQALQLAVQPGVSRVPSGSGSGSKWDNSGFGLHVISQLGLKHGTFRLVSSGSLLETSGGELATSPAVFPGTLVGLRVNTSDAEYFPNQLQSIVQEGERSSNAPNGIQKSASKESRLAAQAAKTPSA